MILKRLLNLQKKGLRVKVHPMKTAMKFTTVDVEARKKLDFSTGDTVKIWSKITDEKGKSRLQAFEGLVLSRKHGAEAGATFTLRKVASGVGVERTFPLFSPTIDKLEVVKRARARRAKLYYVREKAVRDVRRKLKKAHVSASVEEEAPAESES
jgi:large subunit ribosomal protein L19